MVVGKNLVTFDHLTEGGERTRHLKFTEISVIVSLWCVAGSSRLFRLFRKLQSWEVCPLSHFCLEWSRRRLRSQLPRTRSKSTFCIVLFVGNFSLNKWNAKWSSYSRHFRHISTGWGGEAQVVRVNIIGFCHLLLLHHSYSFTHRRTEPCSFGLNRGPHSFWKLRTLLIVKFHDRHPAYWVDFRYGTGVVTPSRHCESWKSTMDAVCLFPGKEGWPNWNFMKGRRRW